MVSCSLLVKNIVSGTSADDLKDVFKKYGKINDVVIDGTSETTAKVIFARVKSAQKAVKSLNGKEVCGSKIEVLVKEDDDESDESDNEVDQEEVDVVNESEMMNETNDAESIDEDAESNENVEVEKKTITCHTCSKDGHISRFCPENPKKSFAKSSCFKCGKLGHKSNTCRMNQNGNNQRSCYNCGQGGHMSRECPNKTGGDNPRACFNCKQTGHMSRECPSKGEVDTSNRSCYKCGQSGHMLKDCSNKSEADSKPKSCFKCGVVGHISRDCSQAGGPVRGRNFSKGRNDRSNQAPYAKKNNANKMNNSVSNA